MMSAPGAATRAAQAEPAPASPTDSRPKPEPALQPPESLPEPTISSEALAMAVLGPQLDREPIRQSRAMRPGRPASVIPASGRSDCPLAGVLVAALEADLEVQAALARIPRESRSVANAVMLWDGRWVEPRRVGGPGNDRTRTAVLASGLAEASTQCREQVMLGPLFLPVNSGTAQWC
jgi:hypothetical protein